MQMQVGRGGLCRLWGPELLDMTPPPLVVKHGGYWKFFWHDAARILSGAVPDTSNEHAEMFRTAARSARALTAVVHSGEKAAVHARLKKKYLPRPYQLQGAHAVFEAKKLLLADSVGLGKTLTSWCARLMVSDAVPGARAVVLCPSALKHQWASEADAYTKRDAQVRVLGGTADNRREMYRHFTETRGQTLVMNYDLLARDAQALKAVFKASSMVIADEASRFKNRRTKTAAVLKGLTKQVPWKLALTATPIEVACENLHSIMEWLDPDILGPVYMFRPLYTKEIIFLHCPNCNKGRCVSMDRARDGAPKCPNCKTGILRRGRKTFTKVTGYRNLDHLKQRTRCRILRRRAEDVGEQMPAVVPQMVWLEFDKAGREAYDFAREGCRAKLRDNPAEPMVSTLDAKRACLSPITVGRKGVGVKTKALVEFLSGEAAGEKALVFTESKQWLVKELAPALKKAGVQHVVISGDVPNSKRQQAADAFRAGDLRVLVMDAVAEYGLNLPCGLVVNADLPWNPSTLEQRVGRARRMASGVKTVRVVNFNMRNSIEERVVVPRLYGRRSMADAVVGDSGMDTIGDLKAADLGELL